MLGLSQQHTKAHLYRALFASFAYSVADLVDAAQSDADMRVPEVHVLLN